MTSNTTEKDSKASHMTEASFAILENANESHVEYENQKSQNEQFSYWNERFTEFVSIETVYKRCHKVFEFKNKLHKHLKQICTETTNECLTVIRFATNLTIVNLVKESDQAVVEASSIETTSVLASSSNIVSSSIVTFRVSTENLRYELDFRSWNYLTAKVTLNSTILSNFTIDCLDTECESILINRE